MLVFLQWLQGLRVVYPIKRWNAESQNKVFSRLAHSSLSQPWDFRLRVVVFVCTTHVSIGDSFHLLNTGLKQWPHKQHDDHLPCLPVVTHEQDEILHYNNESSREKHCGIVIQGSNNWPSRGRYVRRMIVFLKKRRRKWKQWSQRNNSVKKEGKKHANTFDFYEDTGIWRKGKEALMDGGGYPFESRRYVVGSQVTDSVVK
jgi:hypothetical protein